MLDANDAIAITRFILAVTATSLFITIYAKLRFRGFATIAFAFGMSAVALALVETATITPKGLIYEVLLLFMSTAYLASAILIYRALVGYQKERHPPQ